MKKESISMDQQVNDFFPVKEVDYLEIYTGNAKQSAHFFCTAFGFKMVAYSGLETGNRETVSYVLQQNKVRLVITGSLTDSSDVAAFVKKHGDGVRDIALTMDNVESAYKEAVSRGAIEIKKPFEVEDQYGIVKKAIIGTYGDTIHTMVERTGYKGIFLPGFEPYESSVPVKDAGIVAVDHVVGNVERMQEWTSYYEKVMGFKEMRHFTDADISTEYSSLMSKVMHNGGRIKFPINEPAEGKRKSQIQEYLEFFNGPGVQHLAILTEDIVTTVAILKQNGVEFLNTPSSYYETLSERVKDIDEEIEKLKELNILVDGDDEGYLLQIFTKPIVDRPTVFIEVIQRKGARGFGEGNFKALFESIEREQERRGNL
ncbi:4-hydroxyphenylpyruvate dioxygenase [Jeotgalibacillus campisalis]|uniref:4-hydroxyphenylpyruvate dioxygenase n=1 Tax=Jeotgalibacillus campisalis TaxID=220754 RepID=A0A0C2S083_9BACL|nr:4-hydroxyphenylpyruvate dioxygenase [Jeotgalibacillus campisalis]KIL47474.1 4-hydroxyphenylpyruvate dioxygenase [Jeotgalibacillus campisalis]